MLILERTLDERAQAGEPVNVALVGSGFMGRAVVAHLRRTDGIRLVAVAHRTVENHLIRATERNLHSKYQQYELLAKGRTKAERTNISLRGTGTRRRSTQPVKRSQSIAREEMILDLLRTLRDASVVEIAEHFGWKREITNVRVRQLRTEGLIEPTVEPLSSVHQRYRLAKRRRAAA